MYNAEIIGLSYAFTSGLFFGLSDALVRAASRGLKPEANLLLSLLVGTPVLWIAGLLFSGSRFPGLEAVLWFSLAGLLNFVAGRLLFYYSIAYAGAVTASIVTSPTIIIAALMAWPLLKEPLTIWDMSGLILVVSAILLVHRKPSGESFHGGNPKIGVIAGLASTLVFASTAVIVRYASGRLDASPSYGAAISYTTALPVVVYLAYRSGHTGLVLDKNVWYHVKAMLLAGLVVSLAQLSRYSALHYIPVAEASVLIALYPIHTMYTVHFLSRHTLERISFIHIVSVLIAVVGVLSAVLG